MTTKTLGQIASETMAALRAQASAEELSDPAAQAERWEAAAKAVGEVVKNRCALECEAMPFSLATEHCAATIRRMRI